MVTRSLVSYDPRWKFNSSSWINWMVTRSLVSYDTYPWAQNQFELIEWSPDHWWVTTTQFRAHLYLDTLNGHQIIGELRLFAQNPKNSQNIEWSQIIGELRLYKLCLVEPPLDWMVTRSLVSYDLEISISWIWLFDWMVTRSLVSYDVTAILAAWFSNWMVTRSLVSYD